MSVVARVQLCKGNALYINDGIFGHFLEAYFHSYRVPARAIRPVEKLSEDIIDIATENIIDIVTEKNQPTNINQMNLFDEISNS